MIKHLLKHGFQEIRRSPIWAKNLATNIVLGFFGLMMLFYVLGLGLLLHKVADALGEELYPGDGRIEIISRFLIYYFGFEFMMRFFLQNTPVLFIQPYLHLALKKSRIIHFMLRKSIVSIFNVLAFLIFIPFGFVVIYPELGMGALVGWVVTIVGLSWFNHYLGIYFKKKLNDYPNLIFVLGGVLFGASAAEYFGLFQLSELSVWVFGMIMENPLLSLIPMGLTVMFYQLNFLYLKNNTYPEEISAKKGGKSKASGDFAFLKRFGKVGELIALELKLILRHKRPRSTLFMSGLFLLFGLVFYGLPQYPPETYLLAGIFVTGVFFINHGQFLYSWQSGDFDFILTRNINFRQYLESKYWLFVSVSFIAFILSLGYVYFGWNIVALNFGAFLFNVGINIPVVMRMAMFSPKKIDLNRGAAFNYEGVGAAQWLMSLPVLLLPYAIYLPFTLAGYENYGILAVGVIGIIGFVCRKYVLDQITKAFINNRHKIAAGFRAQ